MSARELRRKIDRAETRADELAGWIRSLESARELLLKTRPDEMDKTPAAARIRSALIAVEKGYQHEELSGIPDSVIEGLRHGRPGISDSRIELEQLRDEARLLGMELPGEHEVAEATDRCAVLAGAAGVAGEEARAALAEVAAAAAGLEAAVARYGAAYGNYTAARRERDRLEADYGLGVERVAAITDGDEVPALYRRLKVTTDRLAHPRPASPATPERLPHIAVEVMDEASDGSVPVVPSGSRFEVAEASA